MTSLRTGTTLVALTLGLLAACTPDEAADAVDTAAAAVEGAVTSPAGGTIDVDDITGDPARFEGQTVTVEADLEEVLGPYSFKLDEDDLLQGGIDNDLLVISSKAANLANIDDQWLNNRVRVTGTVRRLAVVDLERETGWDLDPQIEAEIEGSRPVLIATAVERVATGN